MHSLSFQVSSQLKIEEYSLDLQRGVFRKGPSAFDQGVLMSTEKNFILEWVYEPNFTSDLAKAQALNGPQFFESSDPSFKARVMGTTSSERIAEFNVTFADLELGSNTFSRAPGITAVWQCPESRRAIIFLAVHKQPKEELERFIRSFSCR